MLQLVAIILVCLHLVCFAYPCMGSNFSSAPGSGGSSSFADPSTSIGLTATNGVAITGMRSDAAPALSQAIAPTWTSRHIFGGVPAYDLAGALLGVGILMPLDASTHTIAAGKFYDHLRVSQPAGDDSIFTVGAAAIATGLRAHLQASAASSATGVVYSMVANAVNAGPGTVKATHSAAFGSGTSTGPLVAVSAGISPVATTTYGVASEVTLTSTGVDDVGIGISFVSTGDRWLYGIAHPVAAAKYKEAFLMAWMATGSDANADFLRLLNNAGTKIYSVDKSGNSSGGTLIANTGVTAVPTTITGTVLTVGGEASPNILIDSAGASANFIGRRSQGTFASPTATGSGQTLFNLQGRGYETTTPGYTAARATLLFQSAEAFTSTAQGAKITLQTTPVGSTTLTTAATFGSDQSLAVVGALSATGQTLSSTAPSLVFTDTTASAKGLTIAVDADFARIRESAGTDTSLVTLNLAANRMGLGTVPTVRFHTAGTDSSTVFWYQDSHQGANSNGNATLYRKARGSAVGTNTIVASGDFIGSLFFQGANGTTFDSAAQISAMVDGTPGSSADMPGRLDFYTTPDGSATPVLNFQIKSTGQVLFTALKTTGAATGKTIVCVDVTTGQLYASTSGVACAN